MKVKLQYMSNLILINNKKSTFLFLLFFVSLITFGQNYKELIQEHLAQNLDKYDLLESDIKDWKVTNEVYSKKTKVTHIYIQQLYKGIPVFNAVSNISIKEDSNKVLFSSNSFIKNIDAKINSDQPTIKPKNAIIQVASALHLGSPKDLELAQEEGVNKYLFSKSGISSEKIPVELVYQPLKDGSVKLSWLLNISQLDGKHWWNVRVDANTGIILDKNDWGLNCDFDITTGKHSHSTSAVNKQSPLILIKKNKSLIEESNQYNVLALPVESPNHGDRSILTEPSNALASPFGWHDTDGVAGAEYTITRGNNVYALLDEDGNNETTIGYSPDGGNELLFNFPLDRDGQAPETYKDASLANLFYMNNVMHDIFYQYGFDESAGNFQTNNYDRGLNDNANDEVIADGQDGSGKNNANFATPPDGFNPRMQMFLYDNPTLKINSGTLSGQEYLVNEARFTGVGSEAPLVNNPVTGDLVLMDDGSANPSYGCATSGDPINGLEGKIAVIRAAGCTFVSKVELAQNNNAVGVIIVNSTGGELIMGGETTVINIPSVSVSFTAGNEIISAMLDRQTLSATLSAVDNDGSLDNGIIAHEYGHGISNRLIGGGSNTSCMNNAEQLGEGWSDYFGIAITTQANHTETTLRGVGTFTEREAITGTGIRAYPYTTNMSVNPFTFSDVQNQTLSTGSVSVHGVGSIWATMLWDLHWRMINVYGFDADMYNGNGGNNKTMALVIEGLKLTPCSSGFVGARDAILAADEILYDGIHQCLIWEVFARRGLGYSASSGDANDFTDQIAAFDMPPENVLASSVCSALNVEDNSKEIFKIYPNPTTSLINISVVNEVKNATTTIYNINGREVYANTGDLNGTITIDIKNLSQGIYIVKISNEQVSFSQKLIVR